MQRLQLPQRRRRRRLCDGGAAGEESHARAQKKCVATQRGSAGEMSDVLYELGAETWVRFGSNGIGFLNHKNNYNPQVNEVYE